MVEILEWACHKCDTEKEAEAKNYCRCIEGNSFCWYIPSKKRVGKKRYYRIRVHDRRGKKDERVSLIRTVEMRKLES